MRKITRRKRLLSLFTMVILLTSTAWTSFAYADSEGIDQGVPNQLVQELSSEEAPIIPAEETQEIINEENVVKDVGEVVEEEQVVEEEVIVDQDEAITEDTTIVDEDVVVEEEQVVEEELELGENPLIPMAAPYSWLPVVKKQITVRKV